MFHYVYVITNTVNGKIYVGKHTTDDLDDGYMGSGGKLAEAKREFGVDKFERQILQMCASEDEAFEFESLIVDEEFLKRDDVYNVIPGGIRAPVTSSKFAKAIWANPNHRKKCLELMREGRLKSDKCRTAGSRRKDNPNLLKKLSDGLRRAYENPEFRQKLSKSQKESWKNSDPTRHEKVSKAVSKRQSGMGNSHYGKVWIFNQNLKSSIRVAKECVQAYLDSGWTVGRKIKF